MKADQARDDDHRSRIEDFIEPDPAERSQQELRDVDRDCDCVRESNIRAGHTRRMLPTRGLAFP